MTGLVFLKKDEALTDSLKVAETFNKRHDRVLRAADELIPNLPKNGAVKFKESSYRDAKGEQRRMLLMNRDGFTLLVMGFTGKKALGWKLKYIEAFNTMEKLLREKSSREWLETREAGKKTRRMETDAIKELVEYAKAQGSKHPEEYYRAYTRLTNRIAGIESRDTATVPQLNNLAILENIINHVIQEGMSTNTEYKQIFQNCKSRLHTVAEMAFLGAA